ncbi:xanthine dehydrogenase XdhC [Acetobacter tropicalis NRIC 0312]|uniref:Xanthine dehydrogenase accessory protein XdhC n=1 Tax=Acetobacter tropicalis TaxID=104102 RepID=A0A511FR93_9PROT|nr:xanthine dehydrogenase accessory protein XdhC [Acetobacter tropicalis]KXV50791.1 xanthine dehydrogenase [Acetobacter tropicalis]GAL98922.1 xanthine dehydrogenase [Acetobacter tropicalis]GBR69542.1 xanthine dehydrogenase XdhC [Acetobacter tropicalis NRIC 0312]GEL51477.1 xanthine dehydrogenase accessory protein XdhC [Acetobacter tropicalis]
MNSLLSILEGWKPESPAFACVQLTAVRGSTPREAGAFMLVGPDWQKGTIGGGVLEWECLRKARTLLEINQPSMTHHFTLGAGTNQCCGGQATVVISRAQAEIVGALKQQLYEQRQNDPTLLMFGAGHVGRALAYVLAPLPLNLTWVDPRPEEFGNIPKGVTAHVTTEWEQHLTALPAKAGVLVLTPNHSLDALIVASALERNDLGYIGLIGSKTKRRRFEAGFREIGLTETQISTLTCPIGGQTVRDKRPEIIAAMVAAEIIEKLIHRPN